MTTEARNRASSQNAQSEIARAAILANSLPTEARPQRQEDLTLATLPQKPKTAKKCSLKLQARLEGFAFGVVITLLCFSLFGYCYQNNDGSYSSIANGIEPTRIEPTKMEPLKSLTLDSKTVVNHGSDRSATSVPTRSTRCAIIFWGLPRAFRTLVLPSIIQNIITPNAEYNCDYYVHYYKIAHEKGGRSGEGGIIDHQAILSLKDAVQLAYNKSAASSLPTVEFGFDTEESFENKYRDFLQTIRTKKDSDGNYYYIYKGRTYSDPSATTNIVKMWHTIQAGWELMESKGIPYDQVAMFRSDVLYVTPIDIYDNPDQQMTTADDTNDAKTPPPVAVVPSFGKWPVSDRMIYGSYAAVKIWATERFRQVDTYVDWLHENGYPNTGIHSEHYLDFWIFPLIRNITGMEIVPHPTICFLRARANEEVWISDCEGKPHVADPRIMQGLGGNVRSLKGMVESIIGYKCNGGMRMRIGGFIKALGCSSSTTLPQQ